MGYRAVERDGTYRIDDKGSAFQWTSGSVRKWLNKADEKRRLTIRVTNLVQVLVVIFHNVLSRSILDVSEVWTGHSIALTGCVCKQIVCSTEHETGFGEARLTCSGERFIMSRL